MTTPKMRTAANTLLVYLEPRKRVWWLQISFFLADEINSAPAKNTLARFEEPLPGGE